MRLTSYTIRMMRGLCGAVLLTLAFGLPAQAAEPIVIGQLAPMTGKSATQGVAMTRGVKLALERINNGYKVPMRNGDPVKLGPGLLDGRKLKVIVADTQSRPKSGMDAVRKLVNVNKVPIVIGTYSSGVTVPTAQYTNSVGVLQMGVGSTSPKLADINPYFFNAIGTDRLMGEQLAEFAKKDSGATRFTSMAMNNPFGVGIQQNACRRLEEIGVKCVNQVLYASEKSDYRPIIRAVFRNNPQAGIFTGYGTDARLILKQMYELGKKLPKGWYADYPTMWSNEVSEIAKVANGIKGLKPGSSGKFYQSEYAIPYKKKFGEKPLTAFGPYGYDATMLIALAIHKAGTTNPDDLISALQAVSENYKGVTGGKKFDENGMQVNETYQKVIYKNGKLQPYNPKNTSG